jgi:hypothetical protein
MRNWVGCWLKHRLCDLLSCVRAAEVAERAGRPLAFAWLGRLAGASTLGLDPVRIPYGFVWLRSQVDSRLQG